MEKGLPKSALAKVNDIYEMAQQEKNDVQIVKSVLYRTRLVLQTEELGLETVVTELEAAIADSDSPTKQILQSYAGEVFRSYYQSQYYRISQRTVLEDYLPGDIRTWAPANYRDYVASLYLASVQGDRLTSTKTEDIKPLLQNADQKNIDYELKPTLYELLVDKALSYFSQSGLQGLQPSFRFVMGSADYMATAADFTKFDITSEDELSLTYQAALLYQSALAQSIAGSKAHTDYNLRRLHFVKQHGNVPQAAKVYLSTLQKEADASVGLAQFRYRMAAANELRNQGQLPAAKAAYEAILAMKVSDNEKNQAENQLAVLMQPTISITSELVYTPSEKPLLKVDYKNITTAHLSLHKIDQKVLDRLQARRWDDDSNPFRNTEVVNSWSVPLPADTSLQSVSKELMADKLPYGTYAVICSDSETFDHKKDAFHYAIFHVSDIAYSSQRLQDQEQVTVVDRNSGRPLAAVEADVYDLVYDRSSRKQTRKYVTTKTTDQHGQFALSAVRGRNNNTAIVFRKGKDILDLNTSIYLYANSQTRHESQRTEIFTDRSIYRPGQTIHWKALVMNIDKYNKPAIAAGEEVVVTLHDANYQKVSTLEVQTNEYGSTSGNFVIPTGLLTGKYTINAGFGSTTVQVEEYKRPKFEVKLDEITAKVTLDDTVTIAGQAAALSGSAVSDAKVTYTVTRYTYYGWWSWYRRSPSSSVQVAQGELLSESDGKFSFDFVAQGEADADISKNPTYTYEVIVDVTDIAGETRSITERVSVAMLPYSYVLPIQSTVVEHKELESVVLTANNTNGQTVSSEATLVITELKQPQKWQKTRYWSLNGEGGDIYNGNGSIDRLPSPQHQGIAGYALGKVVHQQAVTLQEEGLAYDFAKHMKPGHSYEVTLTSAETYSEATPVRVAARLAVKRSEKGKLPPLKLLYTHGTEKQWEVGRSIDITLGTPDGSLEVYYYILRDWEVVKKGHLTVDDKTTISYLPTEADKGGISLHVHYTKHNRSYDERLQLQIPWTDKQLAVELVTKRDKVLPGSAEQWTLKISGPKGDKVMAEMLATMYDASLDEFVPHSYSFNPYGAHFGSLAHRMYGFGRGTTGSLNNMWNKITYKNVKSVSAPSLRSIGYYGGGYGIQKRRKSRMMGAVENEMDMSAPMMMDEVTVQKSNMSVVSAEAAGVSADKDDIAVRGSRDGATEYYVDGVRVDGNKTSKAPEIAVRKNLDESVFFYPDLRTDADGNVLLDFTMNEALTRWKLLTFAHDKELRYGMTSHEVQTQKELMIVPNAPRFLREGDKLVFPATVSNLTGADMQVNTQLQLQDAATGMSIDDVFGLGETQQSVAVTAGESARVEWTIEVPKNYKSLVKYTVKGWTDEHTDGEENVLPVVTNQMMVTETEVISVKKYETKTFESEALTKQSPTMVPHAFTLEYTSNPVWYAVQALPYIMEYPHECTEQVFNRLYANTLAAHIATANPRIQQIFEVWKAKDSDALISNLEKNEELKYALLEESPWVRQAQSETEQKKRIALLFDMNTMASAEASALRKLQERQLADGSFPWFTGGRGDEYITQVVVMGIAHLQRLGVLSSGSQDAYKSMLDRAITYLDERSLQRYRNIRTKKGDHLSQLSIQYLYIRSFYPEQQFLKGSKVAYDYYFKQAQQYWLGKGLYSEAILGLVMLRADDRVAADIKASLTERSFYSDELGRYWNLGSSYMWYQLPIETHAKMIEFFTEADQEGDFVEDTKIWLLKNKQTNHWKTTKATADAIYALLLQGENGRMISWIEETNAPNITVGNQQLVIANDDMEAGTGYIKKRYEAADITPSMQTVTVKSNSETIGWGATYYQYFEDLDKIESHAANPLTMTKKLYKEQPSDRGPVLTEFNAGEQLTIGDRVISRVEIKVDRDMDYVHLKDMRPSGFEPENVISSYKWQDGIGYYESTRDLATNFFISHLRKGTYVFEYPVRVVHKGDFSAGIATLQCMYAPEFTSHSDGVRVVVR